MSTSIPITTPAASAGRVARGAPAIQVEDVRKAYGKHEALKGVSLTVESGTVLALLGPNGAGKTTLVKVLSTLLRPDSGKAVVAGVDVVKNPAALRPLIGLAGQYAAVDERLTGRENLVLVGRLYHLPAKEARRRADELLQQFSLTDAADRQVKTYSGGMRRRLDLAASLIIKPRVLFLDEPTTGLDPRSRLELWKVIEDLVAGGVTMLLTTQYLEEADRLAHRIAVVDHGRIIAEGTADELKARVGGDVLELRVKDPAQATRAADALRKLNQGDAQVEALTGRLSLPVRGGVELAEVVRMLDAAGVRLADISLRRPTLDDVFLALTGHAAEAEPAPGTTPMEVKA